MEILTPNKTNKQTRKVILRIVNKVLFFHVEKSNEEKTTTRRLLTTGR